MYFGNLVYKFANDNWSNLEDGDLQVVFKIVQHLVRLTLEIRNYEWKKRYQILNKSSVTGERRKWLLKKRILGFFLHCYTIRIFGFSQISVWGQLYNVYVTRA